MQTRNVLFWGLIQILLKLRLCFSSSSMGWEVSPGKSNCHAQSQISVLHSGQITPELRAFLWLQRAHSQDCN